MNALDRWLAGAANAPPEDQAAWSSSAAERALAPLLVAAGTELDEALPPAARRDLVEILSRRLANTCIRALANEHAALKAVTPPGLPVPALAPDVSRWRERFEQYPVLGSLMVHVLQGWRAHVQELLGRLEADRALLESQLFGGRLLPELAGVRGDAGDVHAGGRAVAVLRFADGRQVVYKPKDLRITRAVLELCAFLNERGLPFSLHCRALLARDGYAWEEFVEAAPCTTEAELARFYVRLGMLLRLFQLLEARDLWLDNLVAAGEHPVFIDLEMVLQPRQPLRGSAAEREVERCLLESVARVGILAAPTPIEIGVAAEDFGAVTPPRSFITPVRWTATQEALAGTRRASPHGHVLWTHREYTPALDGKPVRAVDHFPEVLDGYRSMGAALRMERASLLAPGGPLERMAGLPVRYIHRDSWSCYRLAHATLAPRLLTASERREAALASILEAANDHPDSASERAVLEVEVEAFRALDVPYFLCRTDGDALLRPDGRVVREKFFEGTGLDRARARLQAIEEFPRELHEDILWSTVATGRQPPWPAVQRELPPLSGPVDWLAEAVALGDFILECGTRAEGERVWLGLTYDPFQDLTQLEALRPDLLTGSTGVAVVLAELYAASGHERFREAAWAALRATRAAMAANRAIVWGVDHSGEAPLAAGAFVGAGAHLYALHRCAAALGAPELADEARACAASLPIDRLCERTTLDVATGAPGLLLALIACGAEGPARSLAIALERKLSAGIAPPPYPAPERLRELPDLREGLALCAERLEQRLGIKAGWQTPASSANSSPGKLEMLDELRGRVLLAERRTWRRWFSERLSSDRHELSAVWGVPAVAHAFLRLHAPARWSSLRTVSSRA